MTNFNANQRSIEFIPAICPKYGGELRVPKDRDLIICIYLADCRQSDPENFHHHLKD